MNCALNFEIKNGDDESIGAALTGYQTVQQRQAFVTVTGSYRFDLLFDGGGAS